MLERPEIPKKNSWNPGHIYCSYEKCLWSKCQESLLTLEIELCGAFITRHITGRGNQSLLNYVPAIVKCFTGQRDLSDQIKRTAPRSSFSPPS